MTTSPNPRAASESRNPWLDAYLRAVGVVGTVLLVSVVASGWSLETWTAGTILLAAFLIAAELMPVRLAGHEDELTMSSTFSLALLCSVGLAPALAAQALACLLTDLRGNRSLSSALFNIGQYTLSLAGAGLTLAAVSDLPRDLLNAPLRPDELAAVAAAGLVFFAVNNVLAGTAYALAARRSIFAHLREDLAFQAGTSALTLGCVPLVLALLHHSAFLLCFLLVPVFAVYRAGVEARRSQHLELHDRLTGLPNRASFRRRAQAAIRASARHHEVVGVLVMDLDRFKEINDTLGHQAGDALLHEVAARLSAAVGDDGSIARFGGDEFAIVLPGLRSIAEGEATAHRMLATLSRPIAVDDLMLRVEASAGLACSPEHGSDVDELIRRADIAMYVAKSRKVSVQAYTPGDDDTDVDRLALAGGLRQAIEQDEFVLFYQPVIDLRTGEVASAEALVRWEHPQRGLVPPDEFIATAETTGAIRDLTSRALAMAAAQSALWRADGLDVPISVNISAQDLLDPVLPGEIASLLDAYALPADAMRLELTESMLMVEPDRALEVLSRLDAMGVRIAIDDFGTGYSSLAYLAKLPVEQLKIDRAFIRDLHKRNNAVIVASTIELARQLGLRTVAEGVEDAQVLDALAAHHCDLAQGYHFSRPVPAREFSAWVRAWHAPARTNAANGVAVGT